MRQVDEDPEAVARPNEVADRPASSRAAVRIAREVEGNALAVGVRAAPDDAERPKSLLVPPLELLRAGNRLGALEVEHRPGSGRRH